MAKDYPQKGNVTNNRNYVCKFCGAEKETKRCWKCAGFKSEVEMQMAKVKKVMKL